MKTNYKIIFPLLAILLLLGTCKEDDGSCSLSAGITGFTVVDSVFRRLDVHLSGGQEPYSYSWSNGRTDEFIPILANDSSVYSVTVTDFLGCTATASYSASCSDFNRIVATINVTVDILLNFKLKVQVTGGSSPYFFHWSNGMQSDSIIADQPGVYSVTVTDVAGCSATATRTVACKRGCTGCDGDTTITDSDGNVYDIISIGNRCWMASNLRVSAGISEETDGTQWGNLTTPAWCNYGNNSSNDAVYGKLYNWYAVNTGNLCPSGWHIPTHDEWQTLIDSLGGDAAAGGPMKDTTGWTAPNTGATNSSGFTALPGGSRNLGGNFVSVGDYGVFWSSTENSTDQTQAWGRELAYNNSTVSISNSIKARGYSCRCVKD